jgi:truncated hemoglobin YjbI
MRHMPFVIDATARHRWVSLMDRALVETALPAEAVAVLQPFFHHMATFMINTPG